MEKGGRSVEARAAAGTTVAVHYGFEMNVWVNVTLRYGTFWDPDFLPALMCVRTFMMFSRVKLSDWKLGVGSRQYQFGTAANRFKTQRPGMLCGALSHPAFTSVLVFMVVS